MSSSIGDFAEEVLKAKKQKIENSDFNDIYWIPATSNSCERLFSIAERTATPQRGRFISKASFIWKWTKTFGL